MCRVLVLTDCIITIRYASVYLTCSKKLTGSHLSPPHGTNKKLKCETKNKTMSMMVQSRCHEGSPVGKRNLRCIILKSVLFCCRCFDNYNSLQSASKKLLLSPIYSNCYPRPLLLAVPNVTAHPSTASVAVTNHHTDV